MNKDGSDKDQNVINSEKIATEPLDLQNSRAFQVHELEGLERTNVTSAFAGYVDEVLGKINDGKEATVYLCRASKGVIESGEVVDEYLAAKMYRPTRFRNFNNDRNYRNFGKMRDRRMAKAMRGKTNKGQQAFHTHWVDSEWKYLKLLHNAGVRVPRPYLSEASGVLMAYVGNEQGPTPRLVNCKLEKQEAEKLMTAIVEDVEIMMNHNLVHGDFSAYNILYDENQHTIIDVPQAVDTRTSPDAYNLFQRDLINLDKFFSKFGVEVPINTLMRRYF